MKTNPNTSRVALYSTPDQSILGLDLTGSRLVRTGSEPVRTSQKVTIRRPVRDWFADRFVPYGVEIPNQWLVFPVIQTGSTGSATGSVGVYRRYGAHGVEGVRYAPSILHPIGRSPQMGDKLRFCGF